MRHHADNYQSVLLPFAGHIHDKTNFSLLSEEFPFILLANLSDTEAI